MCRPTIHDDTCALSSPAKASKKSMKETKRNDSVPDLRLLCSLDSFDSKTGDIPSIGSCLITGFFFLGFLYGCEHFLRYVFEQNQHWHPLLEDETNRQILARHLGVDAVSCTTCAILGMLSVDVCKNVFRLFSLSKHVDKSKLMPAATHDVRLFTYHPGAFRVALFFLWYQVKNTIDSAVWNDGPEFIFHHVFSMFTAWGSMNPGCGHLYAIFFFGISEISTAVLCILANFDDEHGVVGLGEALPMLKVAVGAIFVILFITCRCILWPVFSYHFAKDILQALKGDDPRAKLRKNWMKFFLVSLTGISVLQVLWLGQIFIIAGEELKKVGLL